VIRVEQGDKVFITLENTHYLPHTIHLHGVDHPWMNSEGHDNDGMEEPRGLPWENNTLMSPAAPTGTMLYHCHVQTGNIWVWAWAGCLLSKKTNRITGCKLFNIGAGQVRHPAAGG